MKKMNRKGFTIVELVIVIAVIAILAAVLIPTFSGIVDKANNSSVIQETRAALTVLLVEENGQVDTTAKYYFIHATDKGVKYFEYVGGEIVEKIATEVDGMTEGKLTPSAKDVVWCGNVAIFTKAGIVDTNLTDKTEAAVADAPAQNLFELADLKNVVIVKDMPDAAQGG